MESLPKVDDLDQLDRTYGSFSKLITTHKHNIIQSALSLESEEEPYNFAGQLEEDLLKCLYLEQFITKHKTDLSTLKQYIERMQITLRQQQQQSQQSQQIQIRDVEEFIKHDSMLKNIDKGIEPLKQNKEYKDFKQKVWAINHSEPYEDGGNDEDIVIASQTVNIICPITKKYFENPVKSKTCGHTYSKEAIMSMLKRTNNVSCPVMGCNQRFTSQQLDRDIEMEETVKREIRKKSRESQKEPDDITEI